MKFSVYIFCFFIFWNCSYLWKEPGRPPKINGIPIKDELRKVYVHNFRNDSYSSRINTTLTRLVKEEVDRRGRFLQTREKNQANYRIYGEIVHFQEAGILLDPMNQDISSEIMVIVKIEIQQAGGYALILPRNELMGSAYYSTQIGFRETQDQAIGRILKTLAIRIVEECEDAWYREMVRLDDEIKQKELDLKEDVK